MHTARRLFLYSIILYVISFTSCGKKKTYHVFFTFDKCPLYIDMPKNVTVFENLGPILYDTLCNHFRRVGFTLSTRRRNNFILDTKIKRLVQEPKFVSLDVLPYAFRAKVEVNAKLFDPEGDLLEEKNFYFHKWFSRSKDPVMGSDYLVDQYRNLFVSFVPQIDQYFRKFLLIRIEKK